MKKDKTKELEKLPFERAIEKLEDIVEQMEDGNLPLDKMISCFEEGNALSKVCGKKLKELERKIEILVKENSEGGEWKDFDEDEEPEEPEEELDEEDQEEDSEDLLF
jgi:exodeoxyribonuclease VII small subunit